MNSLLSDLDLIIFFGSLLAVMGMGLWAGRKEESSRLFFSGQKYSLVGSCRINFRIQCICQPHCRNDGRWIHDPGFAQSHFEITAIAGLLMLCYFFLPVYRKLNVYTLSDYLSKRYDDRSRVSYALIMVIIMVVIQMVPGFYIGSRSINILLQGDTGRKAIAEAVFSDEGKLAEVKVLHGGEKYGSSPVVLINNKKTDFLKASIADGKVEAVEISSTPKEPLSTPISISFARG